MCEGVRPDFVLADSSALSRCAILQRRFPFDHADASRRGMIRVRRNPAAANSSQNSASDRCRPPVLTSILTSLAAAPRDSSDWLTRAG